jgi:hypothetical protein
VRDARPRPGPWHDRGMKKSTRKKPIPEMTLAELNKREKEILRELVVLNRQIEKQKKLGR